MKFFIEKFVVSPCASSFNPRSIFTPQVYIYHKKILYNSKSVRHPPIIQFKLNHSILLCKYKQNVIVKIYLFVFS